MSRRVLVTGAAGYLGSRLVESLAARKSAGDGIEHVVASDVRDVRAELHETSRRREETIRIRLLFKLIRRMQEHKPRSFYAIQRNPHGFASSHDDAPGVKRDAPARARAGRSFGTFVTHPGG